jgi:hypothetical protein
MTTGLKYRAKEADQHKKELKEKPNTPKKANTGSTKLPLPIKVQPKTSESYRTIIKALSDKRMQFHTFKLKEEISYRVV